MVRTQSLTASFPNFCPHFHLKTKPKNIPWTSHIRCPLLVSPPPASPWQQPPTRAHRMSSPFLIVKLSHSVCFCVSANSLLVSGSPAVASSVGSHLDDIHLFPQLGLFLTIIQQNKHNYVRFTDGEDWCSERPSNFPKYIARLKSALRRK